MLIDPHARADDQTPESGARPVLQDHPLLASESAVEPAAIAPVGSSDPPIHDVESLGKVVRENCHHPSLHQATVPQEGVLQGANGEGQSREHVRGIAGRPAPDDSFASDPNFAADRALSLRGATEFAGRRNKSEAVTQSLMLLVTMALMLLAARFAVPQVVEEIRYAWHRGELRAQYESGTEGLRNVSMDALSDAYQMVTDVVGPSVVHIDVTRPVSRQQAEIAKMMSGEWMPNSDQGSGVVVDANGYIVTNRHVIEDGDEITVTLSDGRRCPASVVGTDSLTDLAVLKVNADRLFAIQWGDSDRIRVGSPVWAAGSPFGLDRTFTFGILSGKHRMVRASTRYQDFMQSDVAVNPGNSGGPLVDARGALVGINTAIVGDTYQGVSFSIPSNVAKQIYERLRTDGKVERAWLGIALEEVPDDLHEGADARVRGALVSGLAGSDSPAVLAGLLPGDIILTLDSVAIRDVSHLMRLIGNAPIDGTVSLQIRREKSVLEIPVKLGRRPPEMSR